MLERAADSVRDAGVEQPRSEALLLLAHALGVDRASVLAHPERGLTRGEEMRFEELVERRARREPFAQIVGRREFYGLELVVDRRVLTPRPETEELVQEALRVVEGLRARRVVRPLVVDVGTGSGAIALAVAAHAPTARVVGADVSAEALVVARMNRGRLGLDDRVGLVRGDLVSWLREPADMLVANLPYIPSGHIAGLMPEVARYEPGVALDGGPDGTDLIRRLLAQAETAVRPGGSILLELDPEQMEPTRLMLESWTSTVIADLAGHSRVLRLSAPE